MFKNLLAKYYQENKVRLQKKPLERYQNFSKEDKKSNDTVVNVTKNSQKMKSKSLLSIEKILQNKKKCLIIIIKSFLIRKIIKNFHSSKCYFLKYKNIKFSLKHKDFFWDFRILGKFSQVD